MIRNLMLCSLILLTNASNVAASEPKPKTDWLVGTWVLCEDPDLSPKDSLQFNNDGTGLVIRAKGTTEFLHKHSEQSVHLLANANGYAIPIELSATPELDKLLLHSDKTGNTAIYIRSDSSLVGACSVK